VIRCKPDAIAIFAAGNVRRQRVEAPGVGELQAAFIDRPGPFEAASSKK